MLAEGALLDNTPHTTGAFTRYGVVVWQVPRAVEEARQTSPAVFYRVARGRRHQYALTLCV